MATKCRKCDQYTKDCTCDEPQSVCTLCEEPLDRCTCNPNETPRKCVHCGRWNAYAWSSAGITAEGKQYPSGYTCAPCITRLTETQTQKVKRLRLK